MFFWSVVVTLAVGVGANTAVFAAARAILIDPPPYRDPDTIVIFAPLNHFSQTPLTAADIPELEQLQSLSNVAGCSATSVPMLRDRPSILAAPIEVTQGFFDVFGVPPLLGRGLVASDFSGGQRSAVLSFELWKSMFGGDPNVVGRAVTLDRTRWTIVGVMPRSFRPSCFGIGGPLAWVPHDPKTSVTEFGMRLMARLAPGLSLAQANAERDALARYWATDRRDDRLAAYTLEPINASRAAAARPGLILLQSVAVLLLLVACTNIAGALVLIASERRFEFALRVSMGATPGHLLRQVFAETAAVAAVGATLGAVLAQAVTRWLSPLAAPVLSGVVLDMDWRDVLAALGLGGVALIVFGTLPALAAAYEVGHSASPRRQPSGQRMRAMLLVLQVSATIVLLTGATVLLRSYRDATSLPAGFRSEGLLTTDVYLPATISTNVAPSFPFQQAVRALSAAMTEVRSVDECAFSDASPFVGGGSRRLQVMLPGAAEAVSRTFEMSHVSSNYFSLLQIPLVRGRMFAAETAAGSEVVVSEAFARLFPGHEVLGAVVRTPARSLLIVGVVGDVKTTWLTNDSTPALYAPITLAAGTAVSVIARSPRPGQAIPEMRKAIGRVDPNAPAVAIEPLSSIVWRSERMRRFYLAIAGTFAVVAVLVSALGVFGAVGRVVSLRAKGIAIRVALGARRVEVVRLVLIEGLQPVMIGIAAGLAGGFVLIRALAADPFLQTLLFQVASTDVSAYALPVTMVLASAILACLVPLKRALGLDPVTTLKAE
ncbi:MAG TPA: ABC transporter permease [Vicinamibacterales bacterium]|nr:ABC transporter permease [Vicinamibacterales bacterium]